MIITIQPLKKGYAISVTDIYFFPDLSQFDVTKEAGKLAEVMFQQTGERPTIKILPIQNQSMATKKTYPAKKKGVVSKKAVKKAVKK
jgi:hypothetical protein